MIRHYFKTAWRTIHIHRTYSVSNLIGLTLGLLVILLITSLIVDELSYDKQWKKANELYRLRTLTLDQDGQILNRFERVSVGISAALTDHFPEIIGHTSVEINNPKLVIDSIYDRHAELRILESDTSFFNLFDLQAIEGNPKQILSQAKNLAITQYAHEKYFKGENVIGRIFYNIPEEGDPEPYIINAVLKDIPRNTHLHADAVIIVPQAPRFEPGKAGGMQGQYLQVKSGTEISILTKKINEWNLKQQVDRDNLKTIIELQSVKDIHLYTETGWKSPMTHLYLLIGISILILLLITINFINLTFAHAIKRTLETGIRKVLGANRQHLLYHLASESFLLYGIAYILAFVAYIFLLPIFEQYLNQTITFSYSSILPACIVLFIWLSIGLICSCFPASVLSNVKISSGLKKQSSILNFSLKTGFTQMLIGVQFVIALVICMCMLTIWAQLRYMDNKDLGYNPKNLLVLDNTGWEGKSNAFKNTLLTHSSIASASLTHWTPFSGAANFKQVQNPVDPAKQETLVLLTADFDFVKAMGMQLTAGRTLDPAYSLDAITYNHTDTARKPYANVLVLENTFKNLHLKLNEGSPSLERTPVGILKDFNAASLRYPSAPIIIESFRESDFGCMLVRAVEGQEKEAFAVLTDTWNKFFPKRLSRINWIKQQVENQYEKERKQFQQLAFFSIISVLIAFLGVLGIAIYTIERKIKEIGIRKVLGASTSSIISLLSTAFTRLVLIASVLAVPVAWWLMKEWLDNFAYRIDIPVFLFVLTVAFIFIGILSLVGFKAWRAARANPVDSLRDE